MPPAPGEDLEARGGHVDESVDAKLLLTTLVDSTSDLIWSVEAERFTIQSTNRALREYLRKAYDVEVRTGMTPEQVLRSAELAELWTSRYRRALREGPYLLEYETQMPGILLELRFTLLEREGRVFGVTVFGRDVTERQRAIDQLRRSEAFFRSLQEASPDLSAVVGADGRLRFVSSASRHMLGYSAEELVTKRMEVHVHPEDGPRVVRLLERALAAEGPVQRERIRVRHADGSWRHLESVARSQTSNPAVGGVVFNSRDVTEQVMLAARVEHVREEEKARIARDLHDQLGQLLTGLKLDVLWLEEQLEAMPIAPATSALVERAVAASELADRTIAEVQRIATELRPAALDKLGLGAALRQEGRMFQSRSGITCHVELVGPVSDLPGEAVTALYRIAQEALTNTARHARASHVLLRLDVGSARVALTVEDDGIGMDPADVDDPTSLGIAGMRERAALTGGELILRRRPEGGTHVEVRLPMPAGAAVGS